MRQNDFRSSRPRGTPASIGRGGFSLIELLVVLGIVALLMSILFPAASYLREQSNRARCANNLRQIAMAMIAYSRAEPGDSFPRTVYDSTKRLQLGNAGFLVADSFGKSGYVAENNVPASMFLLLKSQNVDPMLFVCPSTNTQPDFTAIKQQKSSNWEQIPRDMTYSMATPFPTAAAAKAGFTWRSLMRDDFALLADINPGTRGGSNPPNNVVTPSHGASTNDMAAANSNNHNNKGQNVAYGDCHVEFQLSPYCGAFRSGGFRDNIYTAGAGDGGICGDTALPVDNQDSVLLPTDDPGGK